MDLRQSLNAISDVVNNRPRPLRAFDQIYMKTADMLLHAEHAGRCFNDKRVIFIGDGDAIALSVVHLHRKKLLENGPKSVHVLDFDERVVLSIQDFARRFDVADAVTAELYNVLDPLPPEHWEKFDAFHMNPPFGQSNEGRSIEAFLRRGLEAVGADAIGCAVLANDRNFPWTWQVLRATQRYALANGLVIAELLPEFHHYHLDDDPDLRSCSMVLRRVDYAAREYASVPLEPPFLAEFYGKNNPLTARYVRDKTNGGKLDSSDYFSEGFV
jgi:predicted methyltransferase